MNDATEDKLPLNALDAALRTPNVNTLGEVLAAARAYYAFLANPKEPDAQDLGAAARANAGY